MRENSVGREMGAAGGRTCEEITLGIFRVCYAAASLPPENRQWHRMTHPAQGRLGNWTRVACGAWVLAEGMG